ncbi:unnamed protein product, partial [Brenthis ino]
MMVKAILLFCAQALMIQSIAGSCIGSRFAAAPLAEIAGSCAGSWSAAGPLAGPCGVGPYGLATGPYGPAGAVASNGGALPTSSASGIPASGVSLVSENVYEGGLSVFGALPFLGTVALEGALPTAGAGAVAFSAGNGQVATLREDIGTACGAGPYAVDALGYRAGAFGYGMGAPGFGATLAGPYARAGCGYGVLF